MPKRTPNPKRAKIHRMYSVIEAADDLGVHRNTVDRWIRDGGLAAVTDHRPYLIHGRDLRQFLEDKRGHRKATCQPSELYCLGCRAPRPAFDSMADYYPIGETHGRLKALCGTCGSLMNRAVKKADLNTIRAVLDVTERSAERSISTRS